MLRGSPTAVACPNVGFGVLGYAPVPQVALGIISLRWLSELKASAMPSSLTRSVRAKVLLSRAFRLKKSKPTPALRPITAPGRASVHGFSPPFAVRLKPGVQGLWEVACFVFAPVVMLKGSG